MKVLSARLKAFIRSLLPPVWIARIVARGSGKCIRGANVFLAPGVQLIGANHVSFGSNTCVSEQSWFNVNERTEGFNAIAIGSDCFIGRRNFFSSGGKIEIGDFALTTIDCKFICSSHVIDNPMMPYITTGTTADDSIRIGANCFFGAGSMVLGNVTIGHGSVIGAGAQVTKNMPPFSVIIGSPARAVKRYSFVRQAWIDAALVSNDEQLNYPDEPSYLAALRASTPDLAMPLIAASSRIGNL